jgi:hypothetical protein
LACWGLAAVQTEIVLENELEALRWCGVYVAQIIRSQTCLPARESDKWVL